MPMAARALGLLRSTPVRQALGIVALMALISAGTAGIAYLRIRAGLEETILASLDASLSTARTAEELRRQVLAAAAVADPELRVIVLIPPAGPMVGNATVRWAGGSPELLPRDRPLADRGYVVRVIADGRGTLILGESREAVGEMGGVFVALVAFSLVPTLILGRVFCNWMCPYGSLHQFILNANAIAGANTMRFVPAVAGAAKAKVS